MQAYFWKRRKNVLDSRRNRFHDILNHNLSHQICLYLFAVKMMMWTQLNLEGSKFKWVVFKTHIYMGTWHIKCVQDFLPFIYLILSKRIFVVMIQAFRQKKKKNHLSFRVWLINLKRCISISNHVNVADFLDRCYCYGMTDWITPTIGLMAHHFVGYLCYLWLE